MPAPSDRPLRRVTLNLFEDDCAGFERRYGRGWTEQIRRLVHENQVQYDRYQAELAEYLENKP